MLLDHKMIVLADGIHGNVIKLKPPMVVTKEDCDSIIQAVDSVLTKLI
jgi:4-aminobutyrate aminotransferase-like enzyme